MKIILALLLLFMPLALYAAEDTHVTEAEALAHCQTEYGPASASVPSNYPGVGSPKCLRVAGTQAYSCHFEGFASCSYFGANAGDKHYWTNTNDCADRPPLQNMSSTSYTVCQNGCSYDMDDTRGISICVGEPGQPDAFCGADRWTPNGNTCSEGDKTGSFDPDKPVCTAIGMGWVECTKADGSTCASHTSGKRLCWAAGETGQRTTADGKQAGDRNANPADNAPPDNMENPQSEGGQTTTYNGNSTTTEYFSGTGGSPGQSNTGPGGRDPSNGGKGGDGDDEGEDEGSCDPEKEDCTGAGTASGEVGEYGASRAQTVGARYEQFKATAMASPLVSATAGFFQVSVSGSCPTFDAVSNDYFGTITFNFCEPWIQDFLSWGGIVFLMIACYAALKVAIG